MESPLECEQWPNEFLTYNMHTLENAFHYEVEWHLHGFPKPTRTASCIKGFAQVLRRSCGELRCSYEPFPIGETLRIHICCNPPCTCSMSSWSWIDLECLVSCKRSEWRPEAELFALPNAVPEPSPPASPSPVTSACWSPSTPSSSGSGKKRSRSRSRSPRPHKALLASSGASASTGGADKVPPEAFLASRGASASTGGADEVPPEAFLASKALPVVRVAPWPWIRFACTMLSGECLEVLVPRSGTLSTAILLMWNLHERFHTIDPGQATWLVNGRKVEHDEWISDLLTGDVFVAQLVVRQLPGVPVGMSIVRVPGRGSFWRAAWRVLQDVPSDELECAKPRHEEELRLFVRAHMILNEQALRPTWDRLAQDGRRTPVTWQVYCDFMAWNVPAGPVEAMALAGLTGLPVFVAIAQDDGPIYVFQRHYRIVIGGIRSGIAFRYHRRDGCCFGHFDALVSATGDNFVRLLSTAKRFFWTDEFFRG